MLIDVPATDWRRVYQICVGVVNPRPIALVSTISASGQRNLAPFSFFNMVSAQPPVLMVCPAVRPDGQPKDTLRNLRETGEFVVAVVTSAIAAPMVACGAELPPGRSEFDFSGLTPAPAHRVRAARVAESPVNIECRVRQIVRFDEAAGGTGCVVFGDLLAIDCDPAILDERGDVDPHKLQTVGRLGGQWYVTTAQPYRMEIPRP